MKRNNIGELILDGCSEVLDFLYKCYSHPTDDRYGIFQGDKVRIKGLYPEDLGVLCINSKYPDTIFLVGEIKLDGLFPVYIFKNGCNMDQTLGILLPGYSRDEMIATAKGEW